MITAVFLLILAAALLVGTHLGRRVAVVNRRIDADVAFLRAIPADMEWGHCDLVD